MEQEKVNRCEECGVLVSNGLLRCPLCGSKLTDTPEQNTMYPDVSRKKYVDRRSYIDDLLVFFTFLFIGGSIIINLLTWQGTAWFVSVAATIFYTWILVRFTIISDMYVGKKIFLQMLGIMAMMLAFDFTAGFTAWSIKYIMPFILIAGIVYIDLYSYIHKSQWRDNLISAILFVALGFIPLILYLAGLDQPLVPVILCTFASGLTVLGLLRFALRRFGGEIKKRFHI